MIFAISIDITFFIHLHALPSVLWLCIMYINRLSVNDLGNIGYHLEDKYKSWIYLGKAYSVLPCMCLHSDSSPIHGKKKEKERG